MKGPSGPVFVLCGFSFKQLRSKTGAKRMGSTVRHCETVRFPGPDFPGLRRTTTHLVIRRRERGLTSPALPSGGGIEAQTGTLVSGAAAPTAWLIFRQDFRS